MDLIATPAGYWALVGVALATLLWTSRRGSDRAFLTASVIALLSLRWPTILVVDPFIDESQMIAQAITAARYPVPWKDFDPTTSGPLNTYALLLPRLLGFPISWVGSRVVATLLVLVVIFGFYDIVRRLYGNATARIASLVPIVLYGAASSTDLVQYASELLSIALLIAALDCAVRIATVQGRAWTAFTAGLCCGAVPFAKLQATPLAALIAVSTIAAIVVNRATPESIKGPLVAFLGGSLATAVPIFSAVALSGALGDFYVSYVAQAFASMEGSRLDVGVALSISEFSTFFTATAIAIAVFWLLFAALTLRGAQAPRESGNLAERAALPFSLAYLAVAFYAVEAPHRPYAHYMLLTLIPLLLALAFLVGSIRRRYPRWSMAAPALLVSYVAACSGALLAQAFSTRDSLFLSRIRNGTAISEDNVARRIAEIAPLGGRVAIWGYAPYLFVSSQTRMGTRDSISQFAILPGPYREYYRRRFLGDLMRNQPALFVDSVAPGQFLSNPSADAYETYPDLAHQVAASYDLVDQVRGVRIFARKDLHVARRDISR